MSNDGEYGGEDSAALNSFEQAKMDARKQYDGMKLRELVEEMNVTRISKEQLEKQLALVNAAYDVLRFEKVPERMELDGVENVRYDGIGRVSITADLRVSVKDKDGLFGWLKKRKLGDVIKPTVNASTLTAMIKGLIKKGGELPDEFVKLTPITRASITKG